MQVVKTLKLGGGALALITSFLLPATPAAAQDSTPLNFIVPFAPGGGNDVLARLLAPHLSQELHRDVIVQNKAGASGNIGLGFVAHSKADGSTIGVAGSQVVTNPAIGIPVSFDVQKDLAPVGMIAEVPLVLVVNSKLPYKTLEEFVSYAKAHPGEINFGSPGVGVPQHLAGELLDEMAHIKMTHVPYQGLAPALSALLGGQIQAVFGDVGAVLPYIKDGSFRALGVARNRRSALVPTIPAFSEDKKLGLENYNASMWFSVMAPAKTPKPEIDKLNAALNASLKNPDVQKQMAGEGFEISVMTPGQLSKTVASGLDTWTKLAKESHLVIQN